MKSLLFFFILTAANTLFAQDYLFVASYRPNGDGCKDRLYKQVSLESRQPYDSLFRNFYRDNNASSADRWLLKPNEPAIVYEFKTKVQGFTCEYMAHTIVYGKTLEEAAEKMAQSVAKNPKIYLSQPAVVLRWTGKGIPKKDEQKKGAVSYGGLDVNYSRLPNGSVLAKGKNTNEDVKVVITYLTKGGAEITTVEVEPGATFTYKIDESMFDVQVLFKPGTQTNAGTLQKLKQYIKGTVETNSKGEITNTVNGSRQ